MNGMRRAAVAVLLALLVVGCGPAASEEPVGSAVAGGHRWAHVQEFPDMGVRIAPPTGGTPRLTWQRALAASDDFYGAWDSRTPPQVKLAEFRNPARVWHCPASVAVDAAQRPAVGRIPDLPAALPGLTTGSAAPGRPR